MGADKNTLRFRIFPRHPERLFELQTSEFCCEILKIASLLFRKIQNITRSCIDFSSRFFTGTYPVDPQSPLFSGTCFC